MRLFAAIIWFVALQISLNAQVLIDPYVFSGNNNLRTGLEAFWKLDELSGNAIDSSGKGHDLAASGTIEATDGIIDGGRLFANADADDYFGTAAAPWNEFGSTNFTIAFWFRPAASTVSAADNYIITKADFDVGGGTDWMIYLAQSLTYMDGFDVIFTTGGITLSVPINSDVLPLGQWYFCYLRRTEDAIELAVGIYGEATILYSDTEAHADVAMTSNYPLIVGAVSDSSQAPPVEALGSYDGTLDHMGIWLRDLSDCELQKLFELTKHRKFDSRPCL